MTPEQSAAIARIRAARWDYTHIDPISNLAVFGRDPEGEWVRAEDVLPLLSALEEAQAVRAAMWGEGHMIITDKALKDAYDAWTEATFNSELSNLQTIRVALEAACPSLQEAWTVRTESKVTIQHMVERFLSWKLPENFRPDAGISFEPRYNVDNIHGWPEGKHEPTGTNLFDATQAEAMVRYMLEGLPATESKVTDATLAERFDAQFKDGRQLPHPLEDYWVSLDGETGELGCQWSDKPHRHVFDLLNEIVRLRSEIRALTPGDKP